MSTPNPLLVDTNVLIDYQKSDLSVLHLTSLHIGKVNIPRDVLQELRVGGTLSDRDCERHRFTIIDPTLEQLQMIGDEDHNLSLVDMGCLSVAKNCCICVTNDVSLRKACKRREVETMWGLELMLRLLVEKKVNC